MRYIPHDKKAISALLKEIGIDSIDDLFKTIPDDVKFKQAPDVIDALEEQEIADCFSELAAKNVVPGPQTGWRSFLGAGSYYHYIPAAVDSLAGRSEFYSSYTPYQAELSQGNLQAGFEFQSFIASLLNMDVANASMYDGANALLEAILMAKRIRKGGRVIISEAVHPEYRQVVETYARDLFTVEIAPLDKNTGQTDWSSIKLEKDIFAVAFQHPNYFGVFEDCKKISEWAKQERVLTVLCNAEPMAFGAVKPPGDYGIDIFAGEGQSFGNSVNFGGPHLGILATMKKNLRQLPGRLVGRAKDNHGRDGYVLTLSTREQHIRREKATSNICTNQFLLALRAAIYLAVVGSKGLRKTSFANAHNFSALRSLLKDVAGIEPLFSGSNFNEGAFNLKVNADQVIAKLEDSKWIAGRSLADVGFENGLLVCSTEMHSPRDIEQFAKALGSVCKEIGG